MPYPSLSLPKVLALVRKIVSDEGYDPVEAERVVEAMGYNGLNGSAKSALGSARQYGLLLREGVKYRVSKLARRIVEPESDEDAEDATRKAAGLPKVFALLRAHFGTSDVSKSEALPYLVGEGYSAWAVPRILVAYSDTSDMFGEGRVRDGPGAHALVEGDLAAQPQPPSDDRSRLFSYRLPRGGAVVTISVAGDAPTEAVLRVVSAWLEMTKLELAEAEGVVVPPDASSARPSHLGPD